MVIDEKFYPAAGFAFKLGKFKYIAPTVEDMTILDYEGLDFLFFIRQRTEIMGLSLIYCSLIKLQRHIY